MDNADALTAELASDAEELVDLLVRQRGGRLVHDQDRGVERESLGDLHHLLLRDTERRNPLAGIEVETKLLEEGGRAVVERAIVEDERQAPPRLSADEDVLGDRQVGHQVQLLVDHADAEVLRSRGVRNLDLRTLEPYDAGVALVDAVEDLHERRLAGAVLADQGVDLARVEVEVAIRERMNARKVLRDPVHFNEGLSHQGVSCGSL